MSDLLVAIPLLIEWVLVVTVATPFALVNNRFVYAHPRFGLTLWFAAFGSAALALMSALAIAIWSVFDTYARLQTVDASTDVAASILASFAPWLLLAFGGITLALISQRLEPFAKTAEVEQVSFNGGSLLRKHRGVQVFVVELPVVLAFSIGRSASAGDAKIVVTRQTVETLSADELASVLDHEFYHLKARHQLGQALVKLLSALTARLLTTRLLLRETDLLTELAADQFAARNSNPATVAAALSRLIGHRNDRASAIRLEAPSPKG